MGAEVNAEIGGPRRIPQNIRTPVFFIVYMATHNSCRELGDKSKLHMMCNSSYQTSDSAIHYGTASG